MSQRIKKRISNSNKPASKRVRIGQFPSDLWFETIKQKITLQDGESIDQIKRKAIELKHELDLASSYYRTKYEPNAPNIDADIIPELIQSKRNLLVEKRLVLLGMKEKVFGFNDIDSDKMKLYWTRNTNPQVQRLLRISPALTTHNIVAVFPPNFPKQRCESASIPKPSSSFVKTESKASITTSAPIVSCRGINWLDLENDRSKQKLTGRYSGFKKWFDDTQRCKDLNKKRFDGLITTLQAVIANMICYRLHYLHIEASEPPWGGELWKEIRQIRKLWKRAIDKYKLLWFWIVIDVKSLKAEFKSSTIKDLDFTSDKDIPKIIKAITKKTQSFLKKHKIKKTNDFYGLKFIIAKCYKENIEIHL